MLSTVPATVSATATASATALVLNDYIKIRIL
jgi:hypothetical protein